MRTSKNKAKPTNPAKASVVREVTDADAEAAQAEEHMLQQERATLQATVKLFDVHASERLAKELNNLHYRWGASIGWRHYDDRCGVWREITEDDVVEEARLLYKRWYSQAYTMAVLEKQSGKANAMKRLMTDRGLLSTVRLCRGQLKVKNQVWDADPYLMCAPNCVIDLRTGDGLEHDPGYFMTKSSAVDYDPEASHPDLDKALRAIHKDEREWTQIRFGQALTGKRTPDESNVFMKGDGNNGKTCVLYGVVYAAGDYAQLLSDDLLQDAKGKRVGPEACELWGVRLAYIEEMPDTHHLDMKMVKKITSPRMKGKPLYKAPITFDTTHSLFVTHNPELRVSETDWGAWRRLIRQKYTKTFVSARKKKLRSGEVRGDKRLKDRIETDPEIQQAFLTWAVKGAVKWIEADEAMPDLPPTIQAATDEWRAQSDTVLRFAIKYLRPSPTHHIRTAELELMFNRWLRKSNRPQWAAESVSSQFMAHNFYKDNGLRRQYTKVKFKGSRLSSLDERVLPADSSEAQAEVTTPKVGFQAYRGVRWIEPDEAEMDSP